MRWCSTQIGMPIAQRKHTNGISVSGINSRSTNNSAHAPFERFDDFASERRRFHTPAAWCAAAIEAIMLANAADAAANALAVSVIGRLEQIPTIPATALASARCAVLLICA